MFFDKGLEINLRTGFRHESRKNREPISGTFFVKGLENIWELFCQGSRNILGTVFVEGLETISERFFVEGPENKPVLVCQPEAPRSWKEGR